METLLYDLRHGLRLLVLRPLFAGVAILTLALGIGANTAIFSVINGVLLKPLPYEDPERLVMIFLRFDAQSVERSPASGPELVDLRERTDLFAELGGIWARFGTLGGDQDPELIDIGWVMASLFDVWGVEPFLGRTFLPEEDVPNGPPVMLLSYQVWQRRYGGDPQIVGRTVRFNSEPYTVVGVMPPGFRVLAPPDAGLPSSFGAWLPWARDYAEMSRTRRSFSAVARLKEGISPGQAQAEMNALAGRLKARYQAAYAESGLAIEVVPLKTGLVEDVRPALLALFGAAAFLVLIACSNVANLLLVRASERERELALRVALGAGRGRVVRQILSENLVIFLLGGAAGLLVALGVLKLLLVLKPFNLPRFDTVGIDLPTLAFNFLGALATGLVFGAVSAWQASRGDLAPVLKEGGRALGDGAGQKLRNLLVIAEVALSLVLLIGAILMLRTFFALQDVERGFDPESVLTCKLSLPFTSYFYTEPETISSFYGRLLDRIATLPAVVAAGATNYLPLNNFADSGGPYSFDRPGGGEAEWGSVAAAYRIVTPDYFRAMGIELRAGRFFSDHDDLAHGNVAIVDEKLAQTAWPGLHPIGQRLKVNVFINGQTEVRWTEVVGVVEHVRNFHLAVEGREQIYLPHRQSPRRSMALTVRSSVPPENLAASIRREVQALDPERPIYDVRPMEAYVSDAMAQTRFTLQLIAGFALGASLLASVGIYGVIAYAVRQARREIGIRMALGARAAQVLSQVLGRGLKLVVLGEAIGLGVALVAGRVLGSLVFGVSVRDAATFAAAALVTVVIALAACFLPARRATRISPTAVLRSE